MREKLLEVVHRLTDVFRDVVHLIMARGWDFKDRLCEQDFRQMESIEAKN
jgi:hypothetical protein